MNIEIQTGDIVRIYKSQRDGSPISYTPTGKVILFQNKEKLRYGYGKIISIEKVKKNVIIVTAENCIYDFYYGYSNDEVIPLDELNKVLESLGFSQEYSTPINDNNTFYVWANLETGAIITIETWNKENEKTYNTVDVYIPSSIPFNARYDVLGIHMWTYNICEFNAVFSRSKFPLHDILKLCNNSKNWGGQTPNLWHYGDGPDFDHIKVMQRIYDFKHDLPKLFNMDIEGSIKKIRDFEGRKL